MRVLLKSCLLLLPLFATMAWAADDADGVLGNWLTADGKARVEVVKHGDSYDGSIVWLKQPTYTAQDQEGVPGQPKVDLKNPDKALQNRPIIGLALMSGFKYAGDNVWTDGHIYDPERGKLYSCKITLMMDGSLKVRGYWGVSLFGETRIWTRPPADTPVPASKP
ncbi:MAG TPA: DUF2147 domain-containing protein [Gammaproteobacteria bacterium]|jgi:uncharacterized protein (DUF2147 family)